MKAAEIGAALKARLASLTFNPPRRVVWPNRDFKITEKRNSRSEPAESFLVANIVRVPNERLTVSGQTRYAGTLVVVVASPAGVGSGEGDGIADAVAAHFPQDLALPVASGGSVRITGVPSIRDGYLDGAFWRTPVQINFEAMA